MAIIKIFLAPEDTMTRMMMIMMVVATMSSQVGHYQTIGQVESLSNL